MVERIRLPKFLKDHKDMRIEPLRMPPAVKEAVEKSERGNKLSEKERDLISAWLLLFPEYDPSEFPSIARSLNALRAAQASGILPQTGGVDVKGRRF